MKHYLNVCNVNGDEIEPVDIITFGSPCFVAGTKVITERGYINIEHIKVGDMVLTHENRFRPVLKIGGDSNKETYLLKSQGIITTQVTGNHPYYVRRKIADRRFLSPEWKSVDEIESGDMIGIPIPTQEENPNSLTQEDCNLIGRYISNGFLKEENSRLADKINLLGYRDDEPEKIFSEAVLKLPRYLAEAVLDGYLSSYGCSCGDELRLTMPNKVFVMSFQRLVAKVYKSPAFIHTIHTTVDASSGIDLSVENRQPRYQVHFKKESLKHNDSFVGDDCVWYTVQSVEKSNASDVFNMEVEEDNSYTANNAIVHNCQDLSVGGYRKGLQGNRSGLFFEAMRIITEMREKTNGEYPKYAVWENVPGAFSSNDGKDFREVINAFCKVADEEAPSVPLPDKGWPKAGSIRDVDGGWSIAYRVIDAKHWGVPQRRCRIILVADFNSDSAKDILFNSEGLPWHTEKSKESWKNIATNTRGGFAKPDSTGRTNGVNPDSLNDHYSEAICIQGSVLGRKDVNGPQGDGINDNTSFTLNTVDKHAVCYKISAYNSNVMLSNNPNVGITKTEESRTLDLNGGNPTCNQGGLMILFENHRQGGRYDGPLDVAPTICARYGTGGDNVPYVTSSNATSFTSGSWMRFEEENGQTLCARDFHDPQKVVFEQVPSSSDTCMSFHLTQDPISNNEQSHCLSCGNPKGQATVGVCVKEPEESKYPVVRKLTPVECARLQGFPDWWGEITPVDDMSDARYELFKQAYFELGKLEEKIRFNDELGIYECWTKKTPNKSKGEAFEPYWHNTGKEYKFKTKEQIIKLYNKLHTDAPEYKMWGNGVALPMVRVPMNGLARHGAKTMGSLFDGSGGFPLAATLEGIEPRWASEVAIYPMAVTSQNFFFEH